MIKVGICGCGTIGSYILKTILKKYPKQISVIALTDLNKQAVENINSSLKKKIKSVSLRQLVENCDLIIESAHASVVPEVCSLAIKHKKQLMLMSVGGLLKEKGLFEKIEKSKIKLYVPSGAIAGLDALKASRFGKIKSVMLTTRKPVAGLIGAEYLNQQGIDLKKIKKDTIIFEGNALKAVKCFPKNINVAAILSFAGIGPAKTMVKIIASPKIKRNTHTIAIDGDFGTILSCTENVPSKLNPKTSQMAILSALATLDGILNSIKIGT